MDDGITLTGLTIGGTALTAIGAMVGSWIRARYGQTRITPQPLDVRAVDGYAPKGLCDERHRQLGEDRANLFLRMSTVEQRVATVEANHKTVTHAIQSMDKKLDILIRKLP